MVDLKFKYPMTVSGMGMAMSGILSFVCCRVLRLVETKTVITTEFWLTKILPVGFFMAVTLWTGNEVYLYLTVAFIQMLKAFTPVITMVGIFCRLNCMHCCSLMTESCKLMMALLA